MRTTLTLIKADVGGVGGHIKPSAGLLAAVKGHVERGGSSLLLDAFVTHTGDDIAILMTHRQGKGSPDVHELAWNAFVEGTSVAREQGLYGAGQDLLKDAFCGNVKGLGPGVAELEFDERPNEVFVALMADKTDPGAYNLPLYLAFADPMFCPGLLLSPKMFRGFRFVVMDVAHTDGDRVVELDAPESLYDLAALLRDNQRFVIEAIFSREDGEPAVAVSTTRLHNIAGCYTGKDDPVALVRTQGSFPATGELLAPFEIGHYVAGSMRGSHIGPLMPVRQGSSVSYFDGPPVVSALAFSVHRGKLTEPADVFDHPFWDAVRDRVAAKAAEIRRQGFSGPAMLPMSELEYGGIRERRAALERRFNLRGVATPQLAKP